MPESRTAAAALALASVWVSTAHAELIFVDNFETGVPTCGTHLVEAPETCDGDACICQEAFPGYASTGTPDSCNVTCHIPIQACTGGDGICPFVAGSGGTQCGSGADSECGGTSWKYVKIADANTTGTDCVQVNVYGIAPGGSYDMTTCSATGAGTGDPLITAVVDNNGTSYNVANDDCEDATALPLLAGWNCNNDLGLRRMACASPNPAGFRVTSPGVYRLTVTICRLNASFGGVAPLNVWYNAASSPNPG